MILFDIYLGLLLSHQILLDEYLVYYKSRDLFKTSLLLLPLPTCNYSNPISQLVFKVNSICLANFNFRLRFFLFLGQLWPCLCLTTQFFLISCSYFPPSRPELPCPSESTVVLRSHYLRAVALGSRQTIKSRHELSMNPKEDPPQEEPEGSYSTYRFPTHLSEPSLFGCKPANKRIADK